MEGNFDVIPASGSQSVSSLAIEGFISAFTGRRTHVRVVFARKYTNVSSTRNTKI
jgi:hypothetical protein